MTSIRSGRRDSKDRRDAFHRGRRGEWLALWWLRARGYRILAQDYRSPVGEIDVVARRGRTLAIIEVKSRDTLDAAVESISPRQRGRIMAAARLYLGHHPRHAVCSVRFDVMLVAPGRWPRHIVNAWQLDQVF